MRLILTGPAFSCEFFLRKFTTTIGRDSSCDWHVPHDKLSRIHCEIIIDKETKKIGIVDKKSKNGVRINGEKIEPDRLVYLSPNSTIMLANELLLTLDFSHKGTSSKITLPSEFEIQNTPYEKLFSLTEKHKIPKKIQDIKYQKNLNEEKNKTKKKKILYLALSLILIFLIYFLME